VFGHNSQKQLQLSLGHKTIMQFQAQVLQRAGPSLLGGCCQSLAVLLLLLLTMLPAAGALQDGCRFQQWPPPARIRLDLRQAIPDKGQLWGRLARCADHI
jgi:hypothetical protein